MPRETEISTITVVNNKPYRFRITTYKGKDRIVIEHLAANANGAAQITRRDNVPQPHPAYKDGKWQPEYFEKLVLSGAIMRNKSMRKAKQ